MGIKFLVFLMLLIAGVTSFSGVVRANDLEQIHVSQDDMELELENFDDPDDVGDRVDNEVELNGDESPEEFEHLNINFE